MIRFRNADDEQRFMRLMGQTFREMMPHLPPAISHRVLRNMGKMHDMLMLEGIRQGLAVGELALAVDEAAAQQVSIRQLKAFQAHAMIYGSSDTPLQAVELEWMDRLLVPETDRNRPWLDTQPLRFAPSTLDEAEAELVSDVPGVRAVSAAEVTRMLENGDRADERSEEELAYDTMPAFLEEIRGTIQSMAAWDPKSWADAILGLQRLTGIDAGFLDLQLSTPMGLTMLAQCGVHLSPGAGLFTSEVSAFADGESELVALAEAPPPDRGILPGDDG